MSRARLKGCEKFLGVIPSAWPQALFSGQGPGRKIYQGLIILAQPGYMLQPRLIFFQLRGPWQADPDTAFRLL